MSVNVISNNAVIFSAFGRFDRKEKKPVQIQQSEPDNFVSVKIVTNERQKDGKMKYNTVNTIKVLDGTAENVSKVVLDALRSAPSPQKR
jgi:hypothetical protein